MQPANGSSGLTQKNARHGAGRRFTALSDELLLLFLRLALLHAGRVVLLALFLAGLHRVGLGRGVSGAGERRGQQEGHAQDGDKGQ
mgnify:CR=1 FL=1